MVERYPPLELPPLECLAEVASRLGHIGVPYALGGSGLLCALGLARRARDWDLTTDVPFAELLGPLRDLEPESVGPGGIHRDHKLRFAGGAVELIVQMSIQTPAGPCRIPTVVSAIWEGIPLGSPEAWAAAYWLMGRLAKADLLLCYLRGRGADPVIVSRLLREPLPAKLASTLRGL